MESKTFSKARDTYTSLDSDWDNWMEDRSGFDSAFSKWDLCFETWILNSKIDPSSIVVETGWG